MDQHKRAEANDLGTLAQDARDLMAATADVAGEKASNARKRLAAALERSQEMCGRVREKVTEGAKAADQAVRKHPYQTLAIAFGVGAIIGYLVSRRSSRNGD